MSLGAALIVSFFLLSSGFGYAVNTARMSYDDTTFRLLEKNYNSSKDSIEGANLSVVIEHQQAMLGAEQKFGSLLPYFLYILYTGILILFIGGYRYFTEDKKKVPRAIPDSVRVALIYVVISFIIYIIIIKKLIKLMMELKEVNLIIHFALLLFFIELIILVIGKCSGCRKTKKGRAIFDKVCLGFMILFSSFFMDVIHEIFMKLKGVNLIIIYFAVLSAIIGISIGIITRKKEINTRTPGIIY